MLQSSEIVFRKLLKSQFGKNTLDATCPIYWIENAEYIEM